METWALTASKEYETRVQATAAPAGGAAPAPVPIQPWIEEMATLWRMRAVRKEMPAKPSEASAFVAQGHGRGRGRGGYRGRGRGKYRGGRGGNRGRDGDNNSALNNHNNN